jgi:CBS domain containing-hemolysin-like protein
VVGPPAAAVNALVRRAVGAGGGASEREEFLVSVSEVHALYEEVGEEQEMTPEERRLAENVFEFSQTTAEEIMTPRVDIVSAPADSSRADLRRIIVGSRHTRIPVYEGTLDNIVGFVNSKEFLLHPGRQASDLVKPVSVFPETAHIDQIFHEMQRTKVKMVIVVNEFGETVGLITNEDLVEEVVGEIYDEFERDQSPIMQVGPSEYVVDGKLSLDALNEELGLTLSEESSVTLNGLIQELMGQIPRRGSVVEHDGVRFEVLEMDRHRVRRCRVTRSGPRLDAEEAAP